MNISIEQIRPELTWRLRQQVLYLEKTVNEMAMKEDFDGIHFGAFQNGYLVATVSLFQQEDDYQFRKFAVAENVQRTGIGSQLLDHITAFVNTQNGKRIWCNSRLPAIPFYIKNGFLQTGKLFTRNLIDYEIMEKWVGRQLPV